MRSSYTADFNFSKYLNTASEVDPIKYLGHVSSVRGLEVVSDGPRSAIGEMCTIRLKDGKKLLHVGQFYKFDAKISFFLLYFSCFL